jgi:uncharacterized protein (TIGR02145 family)
MCKILSFNLLQKLFIAVTLLGLATIATSQAQIPVTVHAMVSGGGTNNHVYAAIGQPFYTQHGNENIELSDGVAQAQLVTEEIEAEICQDGTYTERGFDLSNLTPGTHQFESYQLHVEELNNYDRLNKLTIKVYEVYEVEASHMYHADVLPVIPGELLQDGNPVQLVEGMNELNYKSVNGCDSLVHYFVLLCPLSVEDADGNPYNTLVLDELYCWTRENLRTEHYAACATDGTQSQGDAAEGLVYHSVQYPNITENLDTYGRLYTWSAASGNADPAATGYVRGACPCGWHIPTAEEKALLALHPAEELNSTELWVEPNSNTNSTTFTALPAGLYNPALHRFEGLRSTTGFWAMGMSPENTASAVLVPYYCDSPIVDSQLDAKALSVRCIRDNVSE